MSCFTIRLISSLSEEPSSIQINEAQLAVVLGRFTLLIKTASDKRNWRMQQKSVGANEK